MSALKLDTTPAGSAGRATQRVISPKGIEAWLVEEYAVPLVAVTLAFTDAASGDADGKLGATYLLSGLLDEGAGAYDAEAFQQRLDDLAIELSFSASHDNFTGTLRTLARHRDAAFDMLRLALNEAHLAPDAVTRVKEQMAAGLRNEAKEPSVLAARTWAAKAFAGHPYGRYTKGSVETLAALTREDLVATRQATLARSNLKVAVVGAIDAAAVAEMLDRVFGDLPAQQMMTPLEVAQFRHLGEHEVIPFDVPQSSIRFGAPGFRRDDPDFIAAAVGNHILGGGSFTSRLWQEVREKRGLAYSVGSGVAPLRHGGYFYGATATSNERAGESIRIIRDEIARFAEQGPDADELDKAKRFLMGSYGLRFDTSTKIAGELTQLQLFGLPIDYPTHYPRMIGELSLDDVRKASRRLLGDGSLLTVAVGQPTGF